MFPLPGSPSLKSLEVRRGDSHLTPIFEVAERIEDKSAGTDAIFVLDQLLGVPLLIATAPLVCAAAITTWCLSRRSPFVAHRRVGQHGELFWMLKLRTMWEKDGPSGETRFVELVAEQPSDSKSARDARVTSRFARFCRRYSIDELPQLAHVVTGQMALIGPRPITLRELSVHYGDAAAEVLRLRPGLSGLWQVMGRSRLSYRQRRRLDLFLTRHYSPGLYIRTLWRTIPAILRGNGAW
jgi:lipopolysaccharide/colanic/teichoic acid biosynthesis glycosyltransferase